MPDSTAAVMLIHGAWHGAWCWEPIVDRLSAKGVRAVAVDLPGHGADPGPFSDRHGDARRVREALDGIDAPVILLGHSYGGAVITEAGDHPAVAYLVYLCALALNEDETCARAAMAETANAPISYDGRPDLSAGFLADEPGAVTLDPVVAAACLYNDCDPETVDWALARLGAQPLVTLQQSSPIVAWRAKPSTYIVCANDLAIHPDLQRILAKRCTHTAEWDSGHSPFLSQPDRLADFLGALAVSFGRLPPAGFRTGHRSEHHPGL
jgi:pimeloyl-ACP methyl ester carboxylesterase